MLLSHDHHDDNLDDAGRALLPSADVVVTTAPGAERLGGAARGLEPWETTRLEAPDKPAIEVTATPCRHGPPLSRPLVGHVIGFALRWDGQEHGVLWITGDTVLYDGVREVAKRLDVDTALIHLGGVRFPITGPVRYSMTARDAVELLGLVRPRTAIPIHYEGWKHFQEAQAESRVRERAREIRDAIAGCRERGRPGRRIPACAWRARAPSHSGAVGRAATYDPGGLPPVAERVSVSRAAAAASRVKVARCAGRCSVGPPSHDTRRWQSGPHLRHSLERLRAILDYLRRATTSGCTGWPPRSRPTRAIPS